MNFGQWSVEAQMHSSSQYAGQTKTPQQEGEEKPIQIRNAEFIALIRTPNPFFFFKAEHKTRTMQTSQDYAVKSFFFLQGDF